MKTVHNLNTFIICKDNSYTTTDTTLPEYDQDEEEEEEQWIVPDHVLQRRYDYH